MGQCSSPRKGGWRGFEPEPRVPLFLTVGRRWRSLATGPVRTESVQLSITRITRSR